MGVDEVTAKRDDRCMAMSTSDLRNEMKNGFNEMRLEFQTLRAAMSGSQAKMADTQVKIERSIQSWSRWNHGATITMFGTLGVAAFGLLFIIWNANKPSAPPAQATLTTAPVIINVPPSSYASPPAPPASKNITH